MSLVLKYSITGEDIRTQYRLKLQNQYKASRSTHIQMLTARIGLLILASYCAYQSEIISAAVLFIVVAIKYLFESLPYSRIYWSAIDKSLTDHPTTHITMEVREDGLFETEEGIESFVPWCSVKCYTEFCDTLFIDLAAGLCAIIPRRSVTPSPSEVDNVIRILQERGIVESQS